MPARDAIHGLSPGLLEATYRRVYTRMPGENWREGVGPRAENRLAALGHELA